MHYAVTGCRCRNTIIVLAIALLALDYKILGEGGRSIAREYARATDEYNSGIDQARLRQAPRADLAKVREDYRRKLTSIYESSVRLPADKLTHDDLTALAQMCELLQLRDESVVFGLAAIERAPELTGAYEPALRGLLNFGRLEEAERILDLGLRSASGHDALDEMHFAFYFAYARDSRHAEALGHLEKYYLAFARQIGSNPDAALRAAAAIPHFVRSYRTMKEVDDGNAKLTEYGVQLETELRSLQERRPIPEAAVDAIRHRSNVYYLHCELQRPGGGSLFTGSVKEWCEDMLHEYSTYLADSDVRQEAVRAIEYLLIHLDVLDDCTEMRAAFENCQRQLAEALFATIDETTRARVRLLVNELVQIDDHLAIHEEHRQIVGRGAPALTGIDWLGANIDWLGANTNTTGKCVVLCFWSPFAESHMQPLSELRRLMRAVPTDRMVAVAVAPYTGFRWEPQNKRGVRDRTQSKERERVDLQRCFLSGRFGMPSALMDPESELSKFYAVKYFP